jgi:hypothetical protein
LRDDIPENATFEDRHFFLTGILPAFPQLMTSAGKARVRL